MKELIEEMTWALQDIMGLVRGHVRFRKQFCVDLETNCRYLGLEGWVRSRERE